MLVWNDIQESVFIYWKKQKKTKLKFIQTSIMLLKSNENKNLKKKMKKKIYFEKSIADRLVQVYQKNHRILSKDFKIILIGILNPWQIF